MVEKLDGISPKPSEGLSEWDATKSGAVSPSLAFQNAADLPIALGWKSAPKESKRVGVSRFSLQKLRRGFWLLLRARCF